MSCTIIFYVIFWTIPWKHVPWKKLSIIVEQLWHVVYFKLQLSRLPVVAAISNKYLQVTWILSDLLLFERWQRYKKWFNVSDDIQNECIHVDTFLLLSLKALNQSPSRNNWQKYTQNKVTSSLQKTVLHINAI